MPAFIVTVSGSGRATWRLSLVTTANRSGEDAPFRRVLRVRLRIVQRESLTSSSSPGLRVSGGVYSSGMETEAMNEDGSGEKFGCERCWPPFAEAAEMARRAHTHEAELIDESHFHVMIRACAGCAQRFVSIFTEIIDWADGDDPQYWTLLPITQAEAADLIQRSGSLSETTLNALGANRRCLRHDRPKGESARSYWSTGVLVGRHD